MARKASASEAAISRAVAALPAPPYSVWRDRNGVDAFVGAWTVEGVVVGAGPLIFAQPVLVGATLGLVVGGVLVIGAALLGVIVLGPGGGVHLAVVGVLLGLVVLI